MSFSSHKVNKLDYSRYLAASLFYLAHRQRDAAGLLVFDDEVRFLQALVQVPTDTPPGDNAPHAVRTAELLAGFGYQAEAHPVPDAEVRAHGLRGEDGIPRGDGARQRDRPVKDAPHLTHQRKRRQRTGMPTRARGHQDLERRDRRGTVVGDRHAHAHGAVVVLEEPPFRRHHDLDAAVERAAVFGGVGGHRL